MSEWHAHVASHVYQLHRTEATDDSSAALDDDFDGGVAHSISALSVLRPAAQVETGVGTIFLAALGMLSLIAAPMALTFLLQKTRRTGESDVAGHCYLAA